MSGDVTTATIGGMDPCKFYPFLVVSKNADEQRLKVRSYASDRNMCVYMCERDLVS